MNTYFTTDYTTWIKESYTGEISNIVGEKKTFTVFDEFQNLCGYLLSPSAIINGRPYVIKTWKFDTKEELIEWISNCKFKLFRCTKVEKDDKMYYEIRGVL